MTDRIHVLVCCLLHLKDVEQQEKRSVHAVWKLPEAMHPLATSTWAKPEKVRTLKPGSPLFSQGENNILPILFQKISPL